MLDVTQSIFYVNPYLSFLQHRMSHRHSALCQSFDSSKSMSDLLRIPESSSFFFSKARPHRNKEWDVYLEMRRDFLGLDIP